MPTAILKSECLIWATKFSGFGFWFLGTLNKGREHFKVKRCRQFMQNEWAEACWLAMTSFGFRGFQRTPQSALTSSPPCSPFGSFGSKAKLMTHKFVPKNRNQKIGKYFAHKCGVWSSQINDSKMPKWAPSSIHRSPQLFLLLPVQHCAKFSVVKHAQGFCAVGNMIKCQIIDLNYQIDLKLCGKS